MHPVEILEKISQEAKDKTNKTIITVYREAFNSMDDIELYKLRALLMEEMERSLESTAKRKSTLDTFSEIYKALTYHNLSEKIERITPFITNAHVTSVEAIFNLHDFKQDFNALDEISELNNELKSIIDTDDITTEQKKVILDICYDVDNAKLEHKITGNSAIKKLHEVMIVKLVIHREIIATIKNIEIKKKLEAVYSKVEAVNKVMNTIASLVDKSKGFIDLLPNGIF